MKHTHTHVHTSFPSECATKLLQFMTLLTFNAVRGNVGPKKYALLHCSVKHFVLFILFFIHSYQCFSMVIIKCCPSPPRPQGFKQAALYRRTDCVQVCWWWKLSLWPPRLTRVSLRVTVNWTDDGEMFVCFNYHFVFSFFNADIQLSVFVNKSTSVFFATQLWTIDPAFL